jgi:UDPglucose 6-dehydrogenase
MHRGPSLRGRLAISGLGATNRVMIFGQWVPTEHILTTNLWSSALSKLTGSAFLAQRISSINSIGLKYLQAEPGFGGSCFQKDILNLMYLCGHYGLHEVAAYWQSVVERNTWQQHRIARLVVNKLFGTITGKRLAVLGFAFKADTNDTHESPAIRICRDLLEEEAILQILDPNVSERQIALDLGQVAGDGSWQQVADVYQAASGAPTPCCCSPSGTSSPRSTGRRWRR